MTQRVYIYGAGLYARIICSYFSIVKPEENVCGFIVSNKNGNADSVLDLPVFGFDDIKDELDLDSTIYIGVADVTMEAIAKHLDKNGIENYVPVDTNMKQEMLNSIKKHFESLPMISNKILIECHTGTSYTCNPKYIVERLHEINADLDIVWGVQESPRAGFPSYVRQVERYSADYFRELYTSRMLISNAGIPFNVRRRGQYHMDTWHGIGPLKKCGFDANTEMTDVLYMDAMKNSPDIYITGSEFNVGFYKSAYHYEGDVLRSGFPRNDIFFRDNEEITKKIREKYDVSDDKKIVLYAPTFRGGKSLESFSHYDINIGEVLSALQERFGVEFVFFGRYHHFLQGYIESGKWGDMVVGVSDYQDAQELLVAADVLISDYSSIMWDFSLQHKPVFLYHNDESEYLNERGFYCPPAELPYPTGHDNDELCEKIKKFDDKKYNEDIDTFFTKYGALDKGNATDMVVEHILGILQG